MAPLAQHLLPRAEKEEESLRRRKRIASGPEAEKRGEALWMRQATTYMAWS